MGCHTHRYFFEYLPTASDLVPAQYTVYADAGNRASGNTPEYMKLLANPNDPTAGTIDVAEFESAMIAGTAGVKVVPLPAAIWGGMALMAGWGGLRLFRRRKVDAI